MLRCALFMLFLASLAWSRILPAQEIVILSPSGKGKASQIAQAISKQLENHYRVRIETDPSLIDNADLSVILGKKLFAQHKNTITSPRIVSFISPFDFQELSNNTNESTLVSYTGASPQTVSQFIKETLGKVKVGYIFSDPADRYLKELEKASEGNFLVVSVEAKNDVYGALNELIERDIDVLLVTNNSSVYSGSNIRFTLEALFRNRIPAISLSRSLSAGAVATVYASDKDVISHTASAARQYLESKTHKFDSYADAHVEIDKDMARIYSFSLQPGGIAQ